MSKGLYIGVSNVARKAKKAYVGVNNVARKVKKIYIGVNGVARLAWQGTVPAGQIVFTSSQVWTVPDGVRIVDVFCVGGGGRGYQAGGGAGGRTATYANVSVTPGQQIGITIGAGATTSGWINLEPMSINTVVAGTTYFGGLSAGGGESALYCVLTSGWNGGTGNYENYAAGIGGNGGSGGGGAGWESNNGAKGGNGGSNGSNGFSSGFWMGFGYMITVPGRSPHYGYGQGTTTRAFGETGGTLYSGGGAGAGYGTNTLIRAQGGAGGGAGWVNTSAVAATPNSGGGGFGSPEMLYDYARNGASGTVIVRWAEQ